MRTVRAIAWCAGWLLLAAVSRAHATETVTLYVTNAQGTVVAEMTPQGQVTYTAAYQPYGKQVVGVPQAGPGYTGHVNDPDTGLVYMQQRYYDPEIGRFLSVDPVGPASGNVFNFGRYAYANNNPIVNIDPDGKDCTTVDKVTTCITEHYLVSFPQQPDFKDFTTASTNYHAYSVPAPTPGMSLTQDQKFLTNNPTPGFPSAATPQGTSNDATPGIGGLSPKSVSPVMSFSLTNQLDGKPVVVNVTEHGHPLQSGIVVREATQAADGTTTIQNWGEGTASLQRDGGFWAKDIDNVWTTQTPGSAPNPTGCTPGWGNACAR